MAALPQRTLKAMIAVLSPFFPNQVMADMFGIFKRYVVLTMHKHPSFTHDIGSICCWDSGQ